MTSSSSLYGTVTTQNSSSTNSTSLYGGADTPIPDSSGNVVVRGDLYVLSGNILTTAGTGNIFPANATTINLGLAATAVNIGAGSGTTTINNNLVVDGSVTAEGADFGNITIGVADDNTITTTSGDLKLTSATDNINLSQGLTFSYSEANNRLNRPTVQSTTGNTSGLRIKAPNATGNAISQVSAFSTNDDNNGKYISFQGRNSATNALRIQTGEYVGGVQQAVNEPVTFFDYTTVYATVNPAGPTVGTDLTTKAYVDAQLDDNTTYTINASTTTGGANFNLVGSDATTDTIKFAQGTGITVSRTDANTITITNTSTGTTYSQNISSTTGGANLNLVGSDSTTDTVKFANGTGVTVAYTDASTATVSIGQAVATTDDVIFNSVNTPTVFGTGNLTLQGGSVTPSEIEIGDEIVASLTGGIGGDTATLTANAGSLTWDHVKGAMVIGSVDGTWSLNADGTTSFPNFTFPYADGTSNQVLRTNGSGVLAWYTPVDTNTTYTQDASSTTGGANLNLVGSDSTTDSVKFAGGTNVTVTATDANTITIAATDTNTTYTIDASSTTGGANLNLVGSDASTDTVKFAEGTGIDVVQTDANTITTSLNATLDDLSNVDNTTTALAAGQMFYYNGTNWVNSVNIDSPNLNRFLRTNTGTGNNAILAISRNRTDDVRAVDGGPWLGFEYVGTDNTQATGPQNTIRSRYQTSGNHQLQFLQNPGNYTSPTVIGQMQRGSTFFNNTSGGSMLNLTDSAATMRGSTTTITNSPATATYASFAAAVGTINQDTFTIKNTAATTTYASFASTGTSITGAGLSQITRTTVGTPGSSENRPAFNIQLSRSDQAAPNNMDGTSFRYRVNGSNNTNYTIADLSAQYATSGDVMWALNLANGDQTGATFSGLSIINSKISGTTINAGTPSATPGASTVAPVASFTPTNNTLKADALTLQDYAGAALVGSAVSYNRVYGQWEQDGPVTAVAANTSYVFAPGTAVDSNVATIVSTSRITPGAAGKYNLQFSLQWANADNQEHTFYVWLRKNGVNVANSTGDVTCLKSAKGVTGWNYIISSANATDYWELAYQVNNTSVTFPYVAAFGTAPNDVPACPALITTLTPVGA